MRKPAILVVVLVGALAIVGWKAAPSSSGSITAPAPAISTASVAGSYSVLFTFHDAQTGQDGAGAGTFVFDGKGNLAGGKISENSRCTSCSGNAINTRAAVSGTYTVDSDGYATIDFCLTITNSIPPGTQYVEVIWEGAFSTVFVGFFAQPRMHGRFVQTLLRGSTTSCTITSPFVQSPNTTVADLEKV